MLYSRCAFFFFFQAEDGIRDSSVTGVQTCALPIFTPDSQNTGAPRPPVARRQPVETVTHGDCLIDNYAWLRDKNNPEVIAYLNAENAYTDAALRDTEPLQEKRSEERRVGKE